MKTIIPEQYNNLILSELPHVVILGAGASCAATPDGEKRGKTLPSMNQLPEVINFTDILSDVQLELANNNFESFFDSLLKDGLTDICAIIESRLYEYFDSIEIADQVTLYDEIVLSLRRKDVIASFNWDPLLAYAYRRHGDLKTLPHLLFLHGNVKQGVCNEHGRLGWNDDICDICQKRLDPTKLLYPVSDKNYSSDTVIKNQWDLLEYFLDEAYFITIFGYSAPYTDRDARERIIEHIASNPRSEYFQIEIIDLKSNQLAETTLKNITNNCHYSCLTDFKQSWLSRHPRFSCEALFEATMQQNPLIPISFPSSTELVDYQKWAETLNSIFPLFYAEGNPKQG